MSLKNFFWKQEPAPAPTPKPQKAKPACQLCKKVRTQGRSGELNGHFVDGDPYTVEIINQRGVEGKECYTLFVQNDPAVGFNEMPIRFCPKCGANLSRAK